MYCTVPGTVESSIVVRLVILGRWPDPWSELKTLTKDERWSELFSFRCESSEIWNTFHIFNLFEHQPIHIDEG
jgi:hypothetical protein